MFDKLFVRCRAVVFGLLVFCVLPVLVGSPAPAAAQSGGRIIRVAPVARTYTPCGSGFTVDTACDLQYALTTVAVSGDELWVRAGRYKPTTGADRTATFQLRSGIKLYGGFGGGETSLTERDPAANVTILNGNIGAADDNSDNSYHVVTGSGTDSTAELDGFTVEAGNANGASSPDNKGGGMYSDSGNPTLRNITFTGNHASDSGGGLFMWNSSLALTGVTFSGNSAPWGGGIYADSSNPTLANVTFSGNSAERGGGMYSFNGNPTLTHVTFGGNSAQSAQGGGGLEVEGGRTEVSNSIFWNSTEDEESTQIRYLINYTTDHFLLLRSVLRGGCPSNVVCPGRIITADPLLGVLGNYGGATQTLPLLPGSSAIDAANGYYCPAADQRGVARPQVGGCDIGAYEARPFTLAKTGGDNQRTTLNTAFATPLGVGVSSASGDPVDGGVVTFAAPSSGASAVPQTSTATIASGVATSPTLFANNIIGAYQVTAVAAGVTAQVAFSLANVQATTTVLSSSANPSVSGQWVRFTAVVVGASPGGTVTFKDGGTDLADCVAIPVSGASATCTATSLALGAHALTAAYSGDTSNNASSGALTQVVTKADTTTTLTSWSNPSTFGQRVTFSAVVSVVSPNSGTPAGTVQFKADGVNLGSAVNLSDGSASVTTAALGGGEHVITAEYNGNADLNASTAQLWPFNVSPASTTTTLASSANPSTYGQTVIFTAIVASGAGTPGGSVQFRVDGVNLGSAVSLSNGQASLSTASLSGGVHTITAQYSGSANYAASSGTLSPNQTVSPASGLVSLTASVNPSVLGQSVSFTATVAGNAPTGAISFSDNGGPIAGCQNVTMVNRTAACTTTLTTMGTHPIGAAYSGDANNGAASGTLTQVVSKADTTTSIVASANPSLAGNTVTFTVTVSAAAPGSGTPTGPVDFYETLSPSEVSVGALASPMLVNGVATFTVSSFSAGVHPLLAVYSGDANFNASSSAIYSQTVNSRIYFQNLPLIFKDLASNPNLAPDLVVDNVTTGPTGPSVTLRNAGSTAVTDDFWVDVYFNPTPAPPPLNRIWQSIAPYGAYWGVTGSLAPGETLTLTVGGPYYTGGSSTFPAGAQVYAYVDCINYATSYGNVQESNEANNVFGPVVSTAGQVQPAVADPAALPDLGELPAR